MSFSSQKALQVRAQTLLSRTSRQPPRKARCVHFHPTSNSQTSTATDPREKGHSSLVIQEVPFMTTRPKVSNVLCRPPPYFCHRINMLSSYLGTFSHKSALPRKAQKLGDCLAIDGCRFDLHASVATSQPHALSLVCVFFLS